MLNTATAMISDVIGQDSENSAFVYGCYSFSDKMLSGLLLAWILKEYTTSKGPLAIIMGLYPVISALIAFLCTYIGDKYYSHKLAKISVT